jgi:hypothetical protein
VHVVSQRAWGLRLRGIARRLALIACLHVAFPLCPQGRHPSFPSRSSIPSPPMPLFTLRLRPRDRNRKTRGQDGSLLPSCKTLAIRYYMPAYPGARTIRAFHLISPHGFSRRLAASSHSFAAVAQHLGSYKVVLPKLNRPKCLPPQAQRKRFGGKAEVERNLSKHLEAIMRP